MQYKKYAFTLLELIISITISSIIILVIFSFVSDTLDAISSSKKQTEFLGSLDQFVIELGNYKSIYNSGSILIDNTSTLGNDVLILKNSLGTDGVIFGVINTQTAKLENNATFDKYDDKIIGFRELSSSEITALNSDPTLVYDYTFYNDKMFQNIKTKSFQVNTYNTGAIVDVNFVVNIDYIELLK